jgi:GxxExxY protein
MHPVDAWLQRRRSTEFRNRSSARRYKFTDASARDASNPPIHPAWQSNFRNADWISAPQVALTLRYDGLVIHRAYQADFIVENEVVIEVKALATVGQRERRQLQTYLELEGFPLGLLLNFGATRLVDGIKRVVNHFPEGTRGASGHKA